MIRPHLANILFLDIETATIYPSLQDADNTTTQLWKEKCHKALEREDYEQAYLEKAALFAEFSRISTVGLAYFAPDGTLRAKAFCLQDERELLSIVSKTLQSYPVTVTHNGLEFDLPFLARRYLATGMTIPRQIDTRNMKPWEVAHKDTMAMWKFTSLKTYISLAALCHALSIPSPKDLDGSHIDGSMASAMFHSGEHDTLKQYCVADTVATARAFLALTADKPLSDNLISLL